MRAKPWPNKLGWDVGPHEVHLQPNGALFVRLFRDGEPWKYWFVPAGTTPEVAVALAEARGLPIDMERE